MMHSDTDVNSRPIERRRHPRIPADQVDISVPNVTSVEMLDISTSGALLSTEAILQVGQRAQIGALLSREPFASWVEVLRVEVGTAGGSALRHRLGVAFTAMDDHSRKLLQLFVKDGSQS
jgi:PilZ domain